MKAPQQKTIKRVVMYFALTLAVFNWGNSLSIYAKAYLADFLIAYAWEQSLEDQGIHKPWSWADTWPVAKMYFPKQKKTLYVLSGGHGSSLAFGPGLVDGTALPEESGTTVIGGHRDTHFAFLQDLNLGDVFLVQDKYKQWRYFRLEETRVTDTRLGDWQIDNNKNEIHLITCYPFDSINPGGPLRFVVIASPIFNNTKIALSTTQTFRF